MFSGYPINEKVDIWALGVILYILLFASFPFNQKNKLNIGFELVLTNEMINSCHPLLIEILKKMLEIDPKKRVSAFDIVTFIEKNNEKFVTDLNKIINTKKRTFDLATKTAIDIKTKSLKPNSTKAIILALTDESKDQPLNTILVDMLIIKMWKNKDKIPKILKELSTRPIFYNSIVAIKALYIIHHLILLGPPEMNNLINTSNLEETLSLFNSLWGNKYSNDNYNREDKLKNAHLSKFIAIYAEFIKIKLNFHKKFNFLSNNYSFENLPHDIEILNLIDKKFINDTIALFSIIHQRFAQLPINISEAIFTLDAIINVFNIELVQLFNLIFFVLIAYKHYHSPSKNEGTIKSYDSQFQELSNKVREYIERYKKFRSDIKSEYSLIMIPSNHDEYFKSLNDNLKFFPVSNFNLKLFFMGEKLEIAGIKPAKDLGKSLYEKINKSSNNQSSINKISSIQNSSYNIVKKDSFNDSRKSSFNENKNNEHKKSNTNQGFSFTDDKFLNSKTEFNFEGTSHSRKMSFGENKKQDKNDVFSKTSLPSSKFSLNEDNNNNKGIISNIPKPIIKSDNKASPNNIFLRDSKNNNIANNNKSDNLAFQNNISNMYQGENINNSSNQNEIRRNSENTSNIDKYLKDEKQLSNNVMNVLNEIFDSNKGNYNFPFDSGINENSMMYSIKNNDGSLANQNNIWSNNNNNNGSNIINNSNNSASYLYNTTEFKESLKEVNNAYNNVIKQDFNDNKGLIKTNNPFNNSNTSNISYNVSSQNQFNNNAGFNPSQYMNYNQQINNFNNTENRQIYQNNLNNANPLTYNNSNQMYNLGSANMNNIYYNYGYMPQYPNSGLGFLPQNINNRNSINNNNKITSSNKQDEVLSTTTNFNESSIINPNNLVTNFDNGQSRNDVDQINEEHEDKFETPNESRLKYDTSNINIYNIQNNFNQIMVKEENLQIEQLANDFLCREFSKGNMHWLIGSKDIELEKQIGFGGSSEVYKGNYRGTEVAVKKLRILEVQEENLKEFKREVSSMIMLRHPNLVLFMGAMYIFY